MATYVTSVGGRIVELYRLGTQGEAGSDYSLVEYSLTTTESGITTIDTFPVSETTTAIYIVQLGGECGYQYSKVTVMHNSDVAQVLESTTLLNEIRLGTFTADIVEDNVELYCDVISADVQINFVKSELTNTNE